MTQRICDHWSFFIPLSKDSSHPPRSWDGSRLTVSFLHSIISWPIIKSFTEHSENTLMSRTYNNFLPKIWSAPSVITPMWNLQRVQCWPRYDGRWYLSTFPQMSYFQFLYETRQQRGCERNNDETLFSEIWANQQLNCGLMDEKEWWRWL